MRDEDGDGYGAIDVIDGVEVGTDCDDQDATQEPADRDNDGLSTCDGDCDDFSAI